MKKMDDGFMYPIIDNSKCINCGLCQKHCPANISVNKNRPQKVFLAWNNQPVDRFTSSSGGVFSAIAKYILSLGGVVFGASYDNQMNVIHLGIEREEKLSSLKGSKYVQSSIGEVFIQVKKHLIDGRFVYFTGTPCQIAGLRSFLKGEYENLLTSDLICHGCPSNDLFIKQIQEIEQKYCKRVKNFEFRNKERFGQGYDIKVTFDDGCSIYQNAELVPYFYGFWKNITLRESCYQCLYTTSERTSDITLADYWLVKKYHKGVKTSNGTSLIMCNTSKGVELIKKCNLTLIEDTLDNALKIQGHLSHSVVKTKRHDSFVKKYNILSWIEIHKQFLTPSWHFAVKMHTRNFFKVILLYRLWK